MSGSDRTILKVENIGIEFSGITAVRDVSFEVKYGEVFTLIGPNGAGKTTVFNLISRVYSPSWGSVRFDGHLLNALPAHRLAGLGLARTFQNIELFEHASVIENLLIGRHAHRQSTFFADALHLKQVRRGEIASRSRCEEILEFLGLQKYRESIVASLPYGIKKVVELARALCTGPKLLLLDEPSSGLNGQETSRMAEWIEAIRDSGVTILIVEHDMGLVSKVSDRVLAMNQGEMVTVGRAADVQAHAQVVEAYLGTSEDATSLRRSRGRELQ